MSVPNWFPFFSHLFIVFSILFETEKERTLFPEVLPEDGSFCACARVCVCVCLSVRDVCCWESVPQLTFHAVFQALPECPSYSGPQ